MVIKSRSVIATPPGATIKEQLVDRGMSQKEFADRMGMSEKHISKLINGEVQLTHEVALNLEMVLGLPAQFWDRLESIYREKIIRATLENEMDEDIELSKKLPYREMAKNNWVSEAGTPQQIVFNLRKYFEVARLALLQENLIPGIACRRLSVTEKGDFALIAWAQKAKIDAREIETLPINIKGLIDSLAEIKSMTMQDPENFCPKLREKLASCGIAIVFLPHINGSFLHGATFYDGKKIVVGLTVRGKDADRFWFSLFHELGHIILGHVGKKDGTTEEDEYYADEFAKNELIPEDALRKFVDNRDFSKSSIIRFARNIGIDVGIVVGRLQKEGYIQYNWYNDLKTRYEISLD